MLEYLMYIFSGQMCMFGYLKTSDIMLSIVSSQKLDWTHIFDTHCIYIYIYILGLVGQKKIFLTNKFVST